MISVLTPVLLGLLLQTGSPEYLRRATPTASTDTFDTFTSVPNGPLERGNGARVIRTMSRVAGGRWLVVDTWYDSAGRETARQSTRTAPRALVTELATVHADIDSAAMLVSSNHVTAWVVPAGQPPRFFDGDVGGERYDLTFVIAAIAKAHTRIGTTFRFPGYTLYGGSPLETRSDSVVVVRRDTLAWGAGRIPVVVLQRPSGGLIWVDEATGAEQASRGNAGPGRWWWHVRRGVTAPQ